MMTRAQRANAVSNTAIDAARRARAARLKAQTAEPCLRPSYRALAVRLEKVVVDRANMLMHEPRLRLVE